MKRLPPIVALLVATCVLVAGAAPCPPSDAPDLRPARGAATAAHDDAAGAHHGATSHPGQRRASRPPCHAEEEPSSLLTRPCPCGCQKERAPQSASSPLGFALARATEPETRPASPLHAPRTAPQAPASPPLGRDPIPI